MDLQRFVAAQDGRGTYDRALAELQAGRKHGHWMWWVFPQLAGSASPSPRAPSLSLQRFYDGVQDERTVRLLDHA